jgi:nicotinamide-nucleotide amidase
LLSIGTELVRGEIVNTNAAWLCDAITGLGLAVTECVTIADDPEVIAQTVLRLARSNDLLLSTGGLGPTTDDVTTLAVARALGVELVRDAESLAKIRALFTRANHEFSESNAKQADFPRGAQILVNDWGTAPGFGVDVGSCRACFLPGVPREMQPMFERHIVPLVVERLERRTVQIRLRTFGASESAINDRLAGIEAAHDVILGYRAHLPEIEVKVMAERATLDAAERAAHEAAQSVRQQLGEIVFGEGNVDLPQVVGELLAQRGWSLALAESCTGGALSALITAEPASHYFKGGVVCYANDAKRNVLDVPQAVLEEHGAVSEAVVLRLAAGARTRFGADVAVSLSGIAGPSGGSDDKPVGSVWWAVDSPLGRVTRHTVFRGSRQQIQRRACFAALDTLRKQLLGV